MNIHSFSIRSLRLKSASCLLALFASSPFGFAAGGGDSRFSDEPIPLQLEGFPERPKPIVEIGQNPFLGRGAIAPGFTTPTGAVWQPVFIAYGDFRTALQTFDGGSGSESEWANRLNLFGNLYLTPTERILIGFTPLLEEGTFTGYNFNDDQTTNGFNESIQTFFFEGDFGELFPGLDGNDFGNLDYGFSIGRQRLVFQDGIMINDTIDAIGITRSSLFAFGSNAARITALFGLNEIHRDNNTRDRNAKIYALLTSADYDVWSFDLDFAYVDASSDTGGDGFYAGLSGTRRFGYLNTTLRVNTSHSLDTETAAISDGTLLFGQFSFTPPHTDDLVYLNTFWGIDEYASAARAPTAGGPLGQTGILFAAVGLGNYGAALGNRADNAVGAALGYQHYFPGYTRQIVFEAGGRTDTDGIGASATAIGTRYQHAFGQHTILVVDAFVGYQETVDETFGLRTEIRIKF